MIFKVPRDISEVREFVLRHEPGGRVWPLGSPNGFANWLFLRRAGLDRSKLRDLAGEYVFELVDKARAAEARPEVDIAAAAVALQLEMSAVNSARRALADLVSIAKRSAGGYYAWEMLAELATSTFAVDYVQITAEPCVRIGRGILDMVLFFARPLVGDSGEYEPTSDSDGELDRAVCDGLKRLDEALREEPEWDATQPYRRFELEALVRLANDKRVASAIQVVLNASTH